MATAGERTPGHVASLVVTDPPNEFLHSRKDVVVHANPVPRIVSRQCHHSFDDVVVGNRRTDLRGRGRVGQQCVEGFRQLLVEDGSVGRQVVEEALQVVGHADRVEPQPEHLGMFGLFERELGQIHLVTESALGAHRRHEGLDVLCDRFLAGDELRAQARRPFAFQLRQRFPVSPVPREVDVCRIPELGVAAGKQLERQAGPVQTSFGQ